MTEETASSIRATVDDWENLLMRYHFDDFARLRHDLKRTLVIDYDNLRDSLDLAKQVLSDPEEAHKTAGRAAFQIMRQHYYDYSEEVIYDYLDAGLRTEPYMKIGFKNIPLQRQLSQITHDDIETMISVEDFVISIDDPRPFLKEQVFRCRNPECGQLTRFQVNGYVESARLQRCPMCNSPQVRFDKRESRYDDFQEIKIQEKQEKIEQGRIPMTKKVYLVGKDWLNTVRAGDYAVINGIVKTFDKDPDYFVEASTVEVRKDDSVLYDEQIDISDETIEGWVRELGEEAFYEKLKRSIAPSVYGHELEKEALLLQMAGSDAYIKPDGTRHRGDINIGMWGSPRTAKSQLAAFASQIYARSEYVSGQVTGVGLTASLVHDKDKGIVRLEAGLYLLASSDMGGFIGVDEIEKTDKEVRKVLSGILDDLQMMRIHKGDIHKNMQVHTASVFIANPATGGTWNDNKDIYQNTGLEPWLLGRMDAQFIFRDIVDPERDRKTVRHYLSQFGHRKGHQKNQDIFSIAELRAWHMYVRKHQHTIPIPDTEPLEEIENVYLKLRGMYEDIRKAFGGEDEQDEEMPYQRVTMGDVGALVRFSCARANAVLREELAVSDVKRAEHIVEGSIASISFKGQTTAIQPKEELSKEDRKLIKTIDVNALASKEFRLVQKKKNRQIRTFSKIVARLGFTKCRGGCQGAGKIYEGNRPYDCPNCDGKGGMYNPLDISYIESGLLEQGFSRLDISDILTIYLRRGLMRGAPGGSYYIRNITSFEVASKQLEDEDKKTFEEDIPTHVFDPYKEQLERGR